MKAVLFSLQCILVGLACVLGSDIYRSIDWTPQNPLFQADGANCRSGTRHLKVELNSKVNFICPNIARVLQQSPTAVQTSTMYENLWLLYNKTAFDACDISLDPSRRRLLTCTSPAKLVFSSVDFALHTAEPDGLTFEPGRSYYFIATSDGTESGLNNTRGGHCSHTSNRVLVYMKIEVYVCRRNQDAKCNGANIGKVQCPEPSPPTTIAHTTANASTTPGNTTTEPSSTKMSPPTKSPTTKETTSKETTSNETTSKETTSNETTSKERPCPESNPSVKKQLSGENSELSVATKAKDMWMIIAVIAIAICFLLLTLLTVLFCLNSFGTKKGLVFPKTRKSSKPERQKSIFGMANRGFTKGTNSIERGDDKASPAELPSVYFGSNFTIETTTFNHGYEPDSRTSSEKDPSVIIQDGDVYYDDIVKGGNDVYCDIVK